MSTTSDVDLPADLVERVLQLPPAAMRKLAALIHDTIEPPDDPEVVRKEWNAIIVERVEGYLNGTLPARDWRESFAEVEKEFREKYPE